MPYVTGEAPVLGDYVKNNDNQPGTVILISEPSNYKSQFVSVRWDDGGPNSPITPSEEFVLIHRKSFSI